MSGLALVVNIHIPKEVVFVGGWLTITRGRSRLTGDPRRRLRAFVAAICLPLWIAIIVAPPSPYLHFFTDPRLTSLMRGSPAPQPQPIGIKLNWKGLWLNEVQLPDEVHAAVYSSRRYIDQMVAVSIKNSTPSGIYPYGPIMGLKFSSSERAKEFCRKYPAGIFRPMIREGRMVFLTESQPMEKFQMFVQELRDVRDWDLAGLLLPLGIVTIVALLTTVPSCKPVRVSRPVQLIHESIEPDAQTFSAKLYGERVMIVRMGLAFILVGLGADLVMVSRGLYPLWWVWKEIILVAMLSGLVMLALAAWTAWGLRLLLIYSVCVLVGSQVVLFQHGTMLLAYPASALSTGLGFGGLLARATHLTLPGQVPRRNPA